MDMIRGNPGASCKLAVSLLALALLLGACTPLDREINSPSPADSPQAASTPRPNAQITSWANCTDPVVAAGEETVLPRKYVTARQKIVTTGSEEIHYLLDQPFLSSITWSAGGPTAHQFTREVGEVTGQSLVEPVDGNEQVNELLRQLNGTGGYVAYKTIEEIAVPLSISCGAMLVSKGTLYTSRAEGTVILDCALPTDKDKDKSAGSPSDAKKKFCPPH